MPVELDMHMMLACILANVQNSSRIYANVASIHAKTAFIYAIQLVSTPLLPNITLIVLIEVYYNEFY